MRKGTKMATMRRTTLFATTTAVGLGCFLSIHTPVRAAPKTEPTEAVRAQELRQANSGLLVFRKTLWMRDGNARRTFPAVELQPNASTVLRVTVSDEWLAQPSALKKKSATDLWQLWVVSVEGEDDPDHWRISLVDAKGAEHAGSKAPAGSTIWAEE